MQGNNQKNNNAKIQHAKIELPKGGGAIRGIGEKFQANAVTGSGSFSVPLPVSPGRGGFSPSLSLSYDSGSGNSPFGLGWNMDLPSITRKTAKGLPKYQDSSESDTFILSGAEDLVPVNGQPNVYRPRTEGLFAHIEKVPNSDGTFHWKVISKDNITIFYGRSENSRIADPENPIRIFSWLIEESRDAKGNIIKYEYKPEEAEGSALYDKNRGEVTANRYIEKVLYCNDISGEFRMQLVFDYNDEPNMTLDSGVKWAMRQDPFSSFKSGFEIRTQRLCRNIIMFHKFGTDWEPVKRMYLNHTQNPVATTLKSIQQFGIKNGKEKSIPAVEYTYSKAVPDTTLRTLSDESMRNLPIGLSGNYQWVDLDSTGLSGILYEQAGAWYYKENLGNGKFGALRCLDHRPSMRSKNAPQIMDIDGDGEKEMVLRQFGMNGYFEYNDGRWRTFNSFQSIPNINWNDPNMRMIDLTGDGRADILITEHRLIRWYPSIGKKGHDRSEEVFCGLNENEGAKIVFNDGTESIYTADMTGDGLTDIVRIRNGEICYWPNMGYGRFGRKVTMANSPIFDYPDMFNQKRIKLADVDGSGTTDIIYLDTRGAVWYRNRSGNSWSTGERIHNFPITGNMDTVSLVDLFADGTQCLVWSSPLPGYGPKLQYIQLMKNGKPHLLKQINNNMGKIVNLEYKPSTHYYLEDKKVGKPWVTKLSFPVHVLSKTETIDEISGSRLTSEYFYHHGYFDPHEREFRGFGMVETVDTEAFDKFKDTDTEKYYVKPIRTKTWFHNGAFIKARDIAKQYQKEYFDAVGDILPDTVIEDKDLTFDELREAHRALKGTTLRQEVYEDGYINESGKNVPYTVSESNFSVKRLQKKGENRHGVFIVHPRETITWHYEQNVEDPRIGHQFTLKTDEYGNILQTANVAYPRLFTPDKQDPDEKREQKKLHVTVEEKSYFNHAGSDYNLIGIPVETKSYEVGCLEDITDKYFKSEAVSMYVDSALGKELIPFEGKLKEGWKQARLLSWTREIYWNHDQSGEADPKAIPPTALLHHVEMAVMSSDLVKGAYGMEVPGQPAPSEHALIADGYKKKIIAGEECFIKNGDSHFFKNKDGEYKPFYAIVSEMEMVNAGYRSKDNYWWNPGLIQFYHKADSFYLPMATEDSWGNGVFIKYDFFKLFPEEAHDAVGNITKAKIDYRTLKPWQLTDPNDNTTQIVTDHLGMVIVTSINGTEREAKKGDTPLFDDKGNLLFAIEPVDSIRDVAENPNTYLKDATTFFHYDLDSWWRSQEPPQFIQVAREIHDSDLNSGNQSPVQISIGYSDGFGREIQSKLKVEPGDAWKLIDGNWQKTHSAERWLVSGRTVFNNKEKPVKQYEPFYSPTFDWEPEEAAVGFGSTPLIHYDPLLRVIKTEKPWRKYGTEECFFFSKVEFTPWEVRTWDENDTIHETNYVSEVTTSEGIKYSVRNLPGLSYNDKSAIEKALQHINTPVVTILDSLGREFVSKSKSDKDTELTTFTEFDITGKPLKITDPRQFILNKERTDSEKVRTFSYTYDMAGNAVRTVNIDAGDDKILTNVMGNPVMSIDAKGHIVKVEYDAIHRPVLTRVEENGLSNVVEIFEYGETVSNIETAKAYNIRTQLIYHWDQSGVTKFEHGYSITGEVLQKKQCLRDDYKTEVNWPLEISQRNKLLSDESFISEFTYDALGRVTEELSPDGSVTKPVFHQSGKLKGVNVKLRNESTFKPFVNSVTYNAKGQREKIVYGNSTETTYSYDEKLFRLKSLLTKRISDEKTLQDIEYTYDPVGNIVKIHDNAHQTVFNCNQKVSPEHEFVYDALYQLKEASGRMHKSFTENSRLSGFKQSEFLSTSTSDSQNLVNYDRRYQYDEAGNLANITHSGLFTRNMIVDERSNRAYQDKNVPQNFSDLFDSNGNMKKLDHIEEIKWDYRDNISSATVIKRSGEPDDVEYYVYDSDGERVRKIFERYRGNGIVEIEEKIYLGGVEIKRIHTKNGSLTSEKKLERFTLHVMDDKSRIATVHNWSKDDTLREINSSSDLNTNKIRYQYGNHLGSASLECDDSGQIISYEEYFPYGGTSFIAGRNAKEVKLKEYRYTGKERDDITGLYYYGARYYAPWLGRWMSADPAGAKGSGLNMYWYCSGNPINRIDPNGMADEDKNQKSFFEKTYELGKGFVKGAGKAALKGLSGILLMWLAPAEVSEEFHNHIALTYKSAGGGKSGVFSLLQEINPLYHAKNSINRGLTLIEHGDYEDAGEAFFGATASSIEFGLMVAGLGKARSIRPEGRKLSGIDVELPSLTLDNKPNFYVRSNGDVIPSKGYRYMDSKADYLDSLYESMEIPARSDGTYISFNKYDVASPEKLQVPHYVDASIRAEFDTLQLLDDISIPYGNWGKANYLEPITKDFPKFGPGGATQAITKEKIKIDKLTKLPIQAKK